MLHKILTAVTALAVVASLLAGAAGQASAASGYDSAYFGESAFLTLGPGQSGQFAVGFNNTGSTGWLTGSTSQVDLAICLPDKTTCNTTSPNAAFANGWLSSTAYATTSTTYVGPGQTGYFVYNVTVPSSAASGTYRFNGDLALHGTASMIHPEGYYQDVSVPNVGAPAKLTCTATPTSIEAGSSATSTITVSVVDASGSLVTSNNGQSIVLSQSGGTSNGSLDGGAQGAAETLATSGGVATFHLNSGSGASFGGTTTGTDNLSAVASGTQITGCSVNVTFTAAGAPTKLSVTVFDNCVSSTSCAGGNVQNQFPAGSVSRPDVRVRLRDASSVTVPATSDTPVTLTSDNGAVCNFGTSGVSDPTVTTKTQTIPTGTSTTVFDDIFVTGVAGTCTLTASATGLTSASSTITVAAAGPAAKLAITSNTCTNNPTTAQNPSSTCDVIVQVQDASGNPVFAAGSSITLKITPGSGNSTCSVQFNSTTPTSVLTNTPAPYGASGNSQTALTDATGKVDFTLQDAIVETCNATATGTAGTTTLTQTGTTVSFAGTGVASKLGNTKATPSSIPANGVSTSTLQVCVTDAAGNTVNSSDSIGINRTSGPGSTTVTSTNPTNAVSGCAQFTVKSVSGVTGTDTYTATDNTNPSFTPATVSIVTF